MPTVCLQSVTALFKGGHLDSEPLNERNRDVTPIDLLQFGIQLPSDALLRCSISEMRDTRPALEQVNSGFKIAGILVVACASVLVLLSLLPIYRPARGQKRSVFQSFESG
jgi:hypothetical protein